MGSKKNKNAKKKQTIPPRPTIPLTRPRSPKKRVNFQSSNNYELPSPSYKPPAPSHYSFPPPGPYGSTGPWLKNPPVTYISTPGLPPIPANRTSAFTDQQFHPISDYNSHAQASCPSGKKTIKAVDKHPKIQSSGLAARVGIEAPINKTSQTRNIPPPMRLPVSMKQNGSKQQSFSDYDDDFGDDKGKGKMSRSDGQEKSNSGRKLMGQRQSFPSCRREGMDEDGYGNDDNGDSHVNDDSWSSDDNGDSHVNDNDWCTDDDYIDESNHDDTKVPENCQSQVPGGPQVTDLLPSFSGHHVAMDLWKGKDRGCLQFTSRAKQFTRWNYGKLRPEAKGRVASSCLQHLEKVIWPNHNKALISAFVERWQPDTNTFHMPFGEMTITLHYVWHILYIPIKGRAVAGNPTLTDVLGESSVSNEMPNEPHLKHTFDFTYEDLINHCADKCIGPDIEAFGYFLYLLANSLFPKQATFEPKIDWLFRDMSFGHEVSRYAWGAATLAYLYRQLRIASRAERNVITGCLTLLECWIYEYFPLFRPTCQPGWNDACNKPRALKWCRPTKCVDDPQMLGVYRARLDNLTKEEVCWMPYGKKYLVGNGQSLYYGTIDFLHIVEPYMPVRVLRQFGFMQVKPACPIQPNETCLRSEIEDLELFSSMKEVWETLGGGILNVSNYYSVADPPWLASDNYMEWFLSRTHPNIIPPSKRNATDALTLYTKASDIMRPWFPSSRLWAHLKDLPEDELEKMLTSFEEGLNHMELAKFFMTMQPQSKP